MQNVLKSSCSYHHACTELQKNYGHKYLALSAIFVKYCASLGLLFVRVVPCTWAFFQEPAHGLYYNRSVLHIYNTITAFSIAFTVNRGSLFRENLLQARIACRSGHCSMHFRL
uniref:Uncharacterized protein n=1 Tax=Rhipicephalus zambeziensis TaxID=60191 RepID=A0A224YH88_9ACAR